MCDVIVCYSLFCCTEHKHLFVNDDSTTAGETALLEGVKCNETACSKDSCGSAANGQDKTDPTSCDDSNPNCDGMSAANSNPDADSDDVVKQPAFVEVDKVVGSASRQRLPVATNSVVSETTGLGLSCWSGSISGSKNAKKRPASDDEDDVGNHGDSGKTMCYNSTPKNNRRFTQMPCADPLFSSKSKTTLLHPHRGVDRESVTESSDDCQDDVNADRVTCAHSNDDNKVVKHSINNNDVKSGELSSSSCCAASKPPKTFDNNATLDRRPSQHLHFGEGQFSSSTTRVVNSPVASCETLILSHCPVSWHMPSREARCPRFCDAWLDVAGNMPTIIAVVHSL